MPDDLGGIERQRSQRNVCALWLYISATVMFIDSRLESNTATGGRGGDAQDSGDQAGKGGDARGGRSRTETLHVSIRNGILGDTYIEVRNVRILRCPLCRSWSREHDDRRHSEREPDAAAHPGGGRVERLHFRSTDKVMR